MDDKPKIHLFAIKFRRQIGSPVEVYRTYNEQRAEIVANKFRLLGLLVFTDKVNFLLKIRHPQKTFFDRLPVDERKKIKKLRSERF